MISVALLVFPLFSLIIIGYFVARLTKIPVEGLAWMNVFIIYISLPAMFFQLLSKTPIEQFSNISFIAISVLATLIIFILAFVIAGVRNGGKVGEASIQGFAAAYGNIGYMGPPLAIAAFGSGAGVPVALVFCFENTMHFILAPLLMGLESEERKSPIRLVWEIIKKIITHPFIIATLLGVAAAIFAYSPPEPIENILKLLSAAAAPMALFTMGVTAALRPLKRVPFELSYLIPLKLIIHPLLVYLLLVWFLPDLDPIWLKAAVLLAALPAATNVFVIAQQYQVWQERASSAVILSTLLAMVSVTIVIYLLD